MASRAFACAVAVAFAVAARVVLPAQSLADTLKITSKHADWIKKITILKDSEVSLQP